MDSPIFFKENNMKIGIHLSTFTKNWAEDLEKHIIRAKEIGYQGVEFPLLDPFNFDAQRYGRICKENDVVALCSTGLGPNSDITSADEMIRSQGIAHLKKCIDIGFILNSPQLAGVTYAPWGILKAKERAKEDIDRSIMALQEVADYAKRRNMRICFEIINRFEGYMINTVYEGLEIIKRVNRENIGLHFDTFHAHIEERNLYEALVLGGEWIKHIHFNENDRGVPLTGQVNFKDVVRGINKINYDNWISLECFTTSNCEVGDGCNIWRQIAVSGDFAASEGYKNIRKILEDF